jgi:hypothetical protein
MNIQLLVPGFIVYPSIAAFSIAVWPNVFLAGRMHVAFGIIQFVALLGYLIYVLRFFALLARIMMPVDQADIVEGRSSERSTK